MEWKMENEGRASRFGLLSFAFVKGKGLYSKIEKGKKKHTKINKLYFQG